MPFFASPKLLQPGLTDFSLEGGLPRLRYGTDSSSYLEDPVGSATLRAGIHDWLTAETHFETGMGVVNGGAGIVARVLRSTVDMARDGHVYPVRPFRHG